MHRFIWVGSIALLGSSQAVWSQEPGSRVRITELESAGFARHTGTVVRSSPDSIVLKLNRGGKTVAFSLAGVSRFEVSQDRSGHTLAGAGIGFLAGASLGALIAGSHCGASCSGEDNLGVLNELLGAGVGAGMGLILGAVVGSSYKTDSWANVESNRWHVSARPAGMGRFNLGVSVRF